MAGGVAGGGGRGEGGGGAVHVHATCYVREWHGVGIGRCSVAMIYCVHIAVRVVRRHNAQVLGCSQLAW